MTKQQPWPSRSQTRHLSRRRFLRSAAAVGFGGATLGLVGCGDDNGNKSGGEPTPTRTPQATATPVANIKPGGKVTMVVPTPDLLDPQRLFQVPVRSIIYSIYDGLVNFDQLLSVVPGLATKWETADGASYVLTLRDGVKFHDGTDFNADSVVTNFKRLLDPATKAPDAAVFPGMKVTAVDPKTVRFENPQPNADFLLNMTEKPGQMISPKALETYGNDIAIKPVGAGPFQFVEWVQGDHVTVKKFPGYWDKGFPFLDEIVFKDIADGAVVSAGLRSGDIDIGSPAAADFDAFTKDSKFQLWEVPGIGYVSDLILFGKNAPFTDGRLRQAVMWALDRAAINKVVYANQHLEPHGIIPPSFWAYNKDIAKNGFAYDQKKAKDLLSAAGQATGFEFTNVIANTPASVLLAETMKAMLQQIGINMKIDSVESNTRIQKQQTGDIQATNAGFSGRVSMDQFMTINYHTTGGFNYAKYSYADRDQIIEKARIEQNRDVRTKLYQDLEKLIIADAGGRIPHVFQRNSYIVRKGIGQQQPAYLPDNMIRFKRVFREA